MVSLIQASCVARNSKPDAKSELTIAYADLRAWGPRESSMIKVSPAATPSGKGRFSSSMKCFLSGTAMKTPSSPEADSQIHVCRRVSLTSNPLPGSEARMSKAASSQHRNAIWPAVVPAVCTTLFSQRL